MLAGDNQSFICENGAMVCAHPHIDPEAAFAALANKEGSLWLDSNCEGARYSYIMRDPYKRFNDVAQMGEIENIINENKNIWADLPPGIKNKLPPFLGGVAGLFGYDKKIAIGAYSSLLAFDNKLKQTFIIASGLPQAGAAERADAARTQIETWRKHLVGVPSDILPPPDSAPPPSKPLTANFTRAEYLSAVEDIKAHILRGDIFQANLAQCFSGRLADNDSAFAYYRRLRRLSPAPFSAFGKFDGENIACASPESFLEVKERIITSSPIKGTARRGLTPAADKELARALLRSEKERAENIMIVDLLRNDLSKSCEDFSIKTPRLCALETFSNVHHLVSTIEGRLRDNTTPLAALTAALPGGSISGAPKQRALEIIAAQEKTPRGFAYGSIAAIGYDGYMSCNIIIRTAFIRDKEIKFYVGGGITAASNPAAEYEETIIKAKHLMDSFFTENFIPASNRIKHK